MEQEPHLPSPEQEPQNKRPVFDLGRLSFAEAAMLGEILGRATEAARGSADWDNPAGELNSRFSESLQGLVAEDIDKAREWTMAFAQHESKSMREYATDVFGRLVRQDQLTEGPHLFREVAQWVALLKDKDPDVQESAALSLNGAVHDGWLRPDVERWIKVELNADNPSDPWPLD